MATPAPEEKKALRARLRAQARAFEPAYLRQSNAAIEQLLYALPEWRAAQKVFLYISMGTEPETRGILARAVADEKLVAVPRCLPGGALACHAVTSLEGLTPRAFGILEPDETAPRVPPERFDLVVTPCVAADEECYRLGNGGGYYDRFLAGVECPVVCLCRGRLVQRRLPREAFDIPVDAVLTEAGMIRRAGGRLQGGALPSQQK